MWNYASLRKKIVRLYVTRSRSDAQNDAAMLGQSAPMTCVCRNIDHICNLKGGEHPHPPPHLVLCEATTLCNGVITCECRSTDHVCKHRPFATMRMICV